MRAPDLAILPRYPWDYRIEEKVAANRRYGKEGALLTLFWYYAR